MVETLGCDSTIEQDELSRLLHGLVVEAEKQLAHTFEEARQKVIVIAGPTAVGKSDTAIFLAKMLGGDVINADSMQVYKGMDVGTAKVTTEEMQGVEHHLLDVQPVATQYNVVDFYYQARQAIQGCLAANRPPIVTGGSGFYLHALLYGPPSGPPSLPEVRNDLDRQWDEQGAEEMYKQLYELDPTYARTITRRDRQKIIRGLEIITITRKPVSSLEWKQQNRPRDWDFRCWFLYRPKEVLYERINQRCDQMVARGFLDEVKALEDVGLRDNPSASQAIGYRQALEFLDSEQTAEDYATFLRSFKKASRRYAKQQFTWFRKESLFRWLDVELHDRETAADMILRDYEH